MAKRNSSNSRRRRVHISHTKRSLPPARRFVSRYKSSVPREDFFGPSTYTSTVPSPVRRHRKRRVSRRFSIQASPESRPRSLSSLRKLSSSPAISLFAPARTTIRKLSTCVRRKIREEVLHALGKTGSSGQRKPRFTSESKIKC